MVGLLRVFLMGLLVMLSTAAPTMGDSAGVGNFTLEAGYRLDELDWNIAGGIKGPNIISELEWEDLEIYQMRGSGRFDFEKGNAPFALRLKGSLAYGWIVDGENQDSDFKGNNRTLEYSRSNNNSDDGGVFDAFVGIGARFRGKC
jgi:hypothetical protein